MTVTTWQNIPDDVAENLSRPAPPAGVTNRVIGGVLTNINGQVTEKSPTLRATESDIAPGNRGILSTAQNNGGFHTANIMPDSTVEIPGFGRTSAKVAAHLGYLTVGADGRYMEATQAGKSEESSTGGNLGGSNEDSQQQQAADGPELFDPDLEAAYGDMIRGAPQGTLDSLMGSANAFIAQGLDSEAIAQKLGARLAAATGKEPEDAETSIELVAIAWQMQANDAVAASGADPAEFYAWAKANRSSELKDAVNNHLFGRSTKGYREMVNDYFDSTVPSVAALKKAGIPTKTSGGETMVKVGGYWMSLGSAVKARLL